MSLLVDPPGAPRTHPNYYPMTTNDLMSQSWSASHDMNNPFHTGTSNMSYDPNQYIYSNPFFNQSQPVTVEERSVKRVIFANPIQQQITSNKHLTNTHSWHETSAKNNDPSASLARHDPVSNRQTVHQSMIPSKTKIPLSSTSVQRAVYLGIDHRATLAERGQTTANKRHHKSTDKTNSTHRSHTHSHHPPKHQDSSDSSISKSHISSTKSLEPSQGNIPGTHRTLTTTSTSTIIPIKHNEQGIINENDSKKSRAGRRLQSQHVEQQSFLDNDVKTTRNRTNLSQQKQHQHSIMHRNNSPARNDAVRRIEIKQTAPIINIPISQSRQKQTTANIISRTRM